MHNLYEHLVLVSALKRTQMLTPFLGLIAAECDMGSSGVSASHQRMTRCCCSVSLFPSFFPFLLNLNHFPLLLSYLPRLQDASEKGKSCA
jgi:hypothetical protein